MLLRESFGLLLLSDIIELAIEVVLEEKIRTQDIAIADNQIVGTKEMSDAIILAIEELLMSRAEFS